MPRVGKEFMFCLLLMRTLKHSVEGLKPMGPEWLWHGADCRSRDLSLSLPTWCEDGLVLRGPRSRSWPRCGRTSLLLCELNVPPLSSLSWFLDVVFIVGNFIAVAMSGRSSHPCSFICMVPPLCWPRLHWRSRQASSGSWAGWKWGICPFSPSLTVVFELEELWCQITRSW